MTLEQPFKDPGNSPITESGWSPSRSVLLGAPRSQPSPKSCRITPHERSASKPSRAPLSHRWIAENMGEAALSRFLDRSAGFAGFYRGALNEEHNRAVSLLNLYRTNLRSLIESDVWT